jgi:hypothetical protein
MAGSAIQKPQMSAKKQTRMNQYNMKEQKSRNGNQSGVTQSKTINESVNHQSLIHQANQLNSEKELASATRMSGKAKVNSGTARTKNQNLSHNYASQGGAGQGGHYHHQQISSSNLSQGL